MFQQVLLFVVKGGYLWDFSVLFFGSSGFGFNLLYFVG